MGWVVTSVLNAINDASMVAAPPVNVWIINFVEEVLWAIIGYDETVRLAIDDHDEKESLEVVVVVRPPGHLL